MLIPLVLRSQITGIWKISDFGLASESKSTHGKTTQGRGTHGYRAPELLLDQKYSSKSDMWALGCILFEMFMRKKAFEEDWQTVRAKESGTVDKQIIDQIDISDEHGCVHCTSHLGEFENQIPVLKEVNETLIGLMSIEAKERPSARDLQELWKKWDE
jgi:serine/threonine protein kinase